MKRLYFECRSGISGDMTVGALLDLGADEDVLRSALSSIKNQDGFEDSFDIEITDVEKCGIKAKKFDVINTESAVERHLSDIINIIDNADLTNNARFLAKRMFEIVAQAEAKAHDTDMNKIHFHEVGAIDSIVDIISTAVCIDNIGIDYVIVSPLTEGAGYVKCSHGILQVPVPAVLNIVIEHGLLVTSTDNPGEMITPTGACIAAALKTSGRLPDKFKILAAGIGAGTKDFDMPNILRVMLIEDEDDEACTVWELSSNIDDAAGEALGFTMEQLLKGGALDVYFTPIYMKKNRPAYILNVLCTGNKIPAMEEIIFSNTTTIGIRRHEVQRTVLERELLCMDTPYGDIQYKKCITNEGIRLYPEYESVRKVCKQVKKGYVEAYRLVMTELEKNE